MRYMVKTVDGRKRTVVFPKNKAGKIRDWLNDHDRFMSIGEDEIINLDHVISIKAIKEDEDEQ